MKIMQTIILYVLYSSDILKKNITIKYKIQFLNTQGTRPYNSFPKMNPMNV